MPGIILIGGPHPTDSFTCCPEIGTCGDRMQGRKQHYKIHKNNTKFHPPYRHSNGLLCPSLAPTMNSTNMTSACPIQLLLLPHFLTISLPTLLQMSAALLWFVFLCISAVVGNQTCLWVLGLRWKLLAKSRWVQNPLQPLFIILVSPSSIAVICSSLHFRPCGYSILFLWVLGLRWNTSQPISWVWNLFKPL